MEKMVKIGELTEAMVRVSEKAGQLARVIRSNKTLLDLLVEEKTGDEKNKRFLQDFKTLADVLVQEVVKHDITRQFPGLVNCIFGEESNKFTNALGKTVEVSVQSSKQETIKLLDVILDGNTAAAEALADVIHDNVTMETDPKLQALNTLVSMETTGIWIDPIDSTAQYIHGWTSVESEGTGVYYKGLQCVAILIGAYDTSTGQPVAGVINQPFSQKTDKGWVGRQLWGISVGEVNLSHVPELPMSSREQHRWVVMSTSEDPEIQKKVKQDFSLCYAAGAGYKILCVCDQLVSMYLLSQPTCFKWDTCGPHAILKALGGGIVDCEKAVTIMKNHQAKSEFALIPQLEACSIQYHKPDKSDLPAGEQWCNSGGVIAFDSYQSLIKILQCLIAEAPTDDDSHL